MSNLKPRQAFQQRENLNFGLDLYYFVFRVRFYRGKQ